MWFLYMLSWLALIIQLCVVTLSIAAGLYYLAELVEEYTVITGKVIKYLIFFTTAVFLGMILFEGFPYLMMGGGLVSCGMHFLILQDFPYFYVSSPGFIGSIAALLFNHYMAFSYFSTHWYPFTDVLAYFTLCLWLVPFAFFVSLSANDNVLPTSVSGSSEKDHSDVVTNYFRKNKKTGLLSFFRMAQDNVLPQRARKQF